MGHNDNIMFMAEHVSPCPFHSPVSNLVFTSCKQSLMSASEDSCRVREPTKWSYIMPSLSLNGSTCLLSPSFSLDFAMHITGKMHFQE